MVLNEEKLRKADGLTTATQPSPFSPRSFEGIECNDDDNNDDDVTFVVKSKRVGATRDGEIMTALPERRRLSHCPSCEGFSRSVFGSFRPTT